MRVKNILEGFFCALDKSFTLMYLCGGVTHVLFTYCYIYARCTLGLDNKTKNSLHLRKTKTKENVRKRYLILIVI